MASNETIVCVDCRVGGKGAYPACLRGNHRLLSFGKHITVPRKTNDRAWKKIANGDIYWDEKKVRKNPSRRDWHLENIIMDGVRWIPVAWNSPEWKKRKAGRLVGRWS